MNKTQIDRNKDRGKYCKGCAWLHVGVNVDHNHCNYTKEHCQDELEGRTNGKYSYLNKALEEWLTPSICRWFWDKKINPIPDKSGIYYKAPLSHACPKIPMIYKGKS